MTKLQRKRALFHRAANGEASLLHPGETSSDAHALGVQIMACEDLCKLILSRRDRAKLRAISVGIDLKATAGREKGRLSAAEHADLASRTYAVRQKIVDIGHNRLTRLRAAKAELDDRLATAKAPFDLKDLILREEVIKLLAELGKPVDLSQLRSMRDLGFSWKKVITKDRKVRYYLVTPTEKFGVWTKDQYENLRRRAGQNNSAPPARQEVTPG